ncbi:MAG: S4 domain-containing protein, partial [Pseudomonadota bacterium]
DAAATGDKASDVVGRHRLAALGGAEINEAKKALANAATAMVHGEAAAQTAAETARQTFEQGGASAGLPRITVPRGDLAVGTGLLGLLVEAGLAASNSEARRAVSGNAIKVNDARVDDPKTLITLADLDGDAIKLSHGKKRHALVVPDA